MAVVTSRSPLGDFDAHRTYDRAVQEYEDASREFWQFVALRSVERLRLRPGERVLDVPCGTGPALVAAAAAVGPSGHVLGIDAGPRMVEVAKDRVAASGFANIEARVGDMATIESPGVPFDAVVCALGVFFVDDMAALARSLVDLVQPGTGRVVVSVFGESFFEPMRSIFLDVVESVAPGAAVIEPWRRTEHEPTLRGLFDGTDIGELQIVTDEDRLPLREPSDWWRIVMGSGLRRTVERLDDAMATEVRARCEHYVAGAAVTALTTSSRYAVARRRGRPAGVNLGDAALPG